MVFSKENQSKQERLYDFAYSLLILLAVNFLVYGPSLTFNFLVVSDDQAYIFRNPYLQPTSLSNLTAIFSNFHYASYIPVTLTTYSLDFTFWKFDAFGYHLTQILLHSLNASLIYFLLLKFGLIRYLALGLTLIYSVHPVHVESVVWVSERKNLVSALFIFLAFLCYKNSADRDSGRKLYLGFALFFFLMALMSKEVAVMLPFVLILYDICFSRRGFYLLEKIPFLGLGLFFAGLTIYTQAGQGAIYGYAGGSVVAAFFYALRVFWDYCVSILFPFALAPLYYYKTSELWDWRLLLACLLVPSIILFAVRNYRKYPYFSFAVGWFFIWLIPVSGIVPLSTIRQDRYLYLSSLSIILVLLVPVINSRWMKSQGNACLAILGVIIILLGGLTNNYSFTFASGLAYWNRVAETYPEWSKAQFLVGRQCWQIGQENCAVDFYKRALKADPNNAQALNNLGAIWIERGNYDRAKNYIERALKIDPKIYVAYRNLTVIAVRTGKQLDKIPEWKRKYEELESGAKNKRDYNLGPFRYR